MSDPDYLRSQQYHNSSNLNARIALHARFSLDPKGWQRWVFEQLDLRDGCRVLELGCGPGKLWLENLERMPVGGAIILSDFSAGMVEQARENLTGKMAAHFEIIDARSIPYPEASFDGVIANHMLYHVPDRDRAFMEIRRVLQPGGRLFATTGGERHMVELYELVQKFDGVVAADGWYLEPIGFSLESGADQLAPWFKSIEVRRYENALMVSEAAPLVDYILSTVRLSLAEGRRHDLLEYVQAQLDTNGGAIRITIDSGMFIACV